MHILDRFQENLKYAYYGSNLRISYYNGSNAHILDQNLFFNIFCETFEAQTRKKQNKLDILQREERNAYCGSKALEKVLTLHLQTLSIPKVWIYTYFGSKLFLIFQLFVHFRNSRKLFFSCFIMRFG